MNDLLNSLSQMQTIEVFFWFVLVGLAVVLIASIVGCVIKAWYKFAPKSFCVTLFIIGMSIAVYGAVGLILENISK